MEMHSAARLEVGAYNDEESRFLAFRSDLECGARRVRFLLTGIATLVLLFICLWLMPYLHIG
jgi:hypothetical protein